MTRVAPLPGVSKVERERCPDAKIALVMCLNDVMGIAQVSLSSLISDHGNFFLCQSLA